MITEISEMCKKHGFSKRGNAFFRVHGDGVLQVLQYSLKRHPFYEEVIYIGLFSMYSELLPQWFTASGCIPTYIEKYLETPRWSLETTQKLRMAAFQHVPAQLHVNDFENVCTFHIDLKGLETVMFPFLDAITTQKAMLRGIESLEQCSSPVPPSQGDKGKRWTDSRKFAAYLACGEVENAARIEQSLLALCLRQENPSQLCMEDIDRHREKIALALSGDPEKINGYLQSNYVHNCELASFCMRKRTPKISIYK